MTARSANDLVAEATAALVDHADVAHSLDRLLLGSLEALGVHAAGLLVREGAGGSVELLASTSHRTDQLELFELQHEAGPCVEAIQTDATVSAGTVEEVRRRWPPVGPAIVAAGYAAAYACPMHWRGQVIGALNTYRRAEPGPGDGGPGAEARTEPGPGLIAVEVDQTLAQTVADLATLIIFAPTVADAAPAGEQIRRALAGRIVLEQAKGVIAQRDGVALDEAYLRLRARATRTRQTITEAATRILDDVVREPR